VSISGTSVVVGAPAVSFKNAIPKAFIYFNCVSQTSESCSSGSQTPVTLQGRLGSEFGASVAISSDRVVVGSPALNNNLGRKNTHAHTNIQYICKHYCIHNNTHTNIHTH